MHVDRLPHSLLLALGLGCAPSVQPDNGSGSQGQGTEGSSGGSTFGSDSLITSGSSTTTGDPDITVGPCLLDIGGGRWTTGESSSSESGSGDSTSSSSGSSGSGSDSGTGEGTDSTGAPGVVDDSNAQRRDDLIGRLFESGVLPPDVARRLTR